MGGASVNRRGLLMGGVAVGVGGCANLPLGSRNLRVAVAQMPSANGDIAGNLERAGALAGVAAEKGAQLVVFPEFMPGGYDLSVSCWDAAEPFDGQTVKWLRAISRQHRIAVGTSFLEADGEDFYNTFVLSDRTGAVRGAVRKEVPAGAEGFFFRGERNPHIIETDFGRVGVMICQENYRCFAAEHMRVGRPDIILAPHSFPDMSESGGLPSPPGTFVAQFHARTSGAPVAMVNKIGRWSSSVIGSNQPIGGFFPGRSAIVQRDGTTALVMDEREGVGCADVAIGNAKPSSGVSRCDGDILPELTLTPPGLREVALEAGANLEAHATSFYQTSPLRRERARSISGKPLQNSL